MFKKAVTFRPIKLSDHDLLQLTEEQLLELPEAVVRRLSVKLLYDLKEARERLRRNSRNSSRPPSSDLPWDQAGNDDSAEQDEDKLTQQEQDEFHDESINVDGGHASPTDIEKQAPDEASATAQPQPPKDDPNSQRKPGKQLGAPAMDVPKR